MHDLPANHSAHFLEKLEAALARSGMSQTRFGYIHFGDPGFMRRMRKGQRLHKKTIEHIHLVVDSR